MTSTAQMTKPKTSDWSSMFPNEQVTEALSNLFMKKLIAVAISNVVYLRAIFPENAFGDRNLEELNLKILSENSGCPGACQVINWVKGCFDALDKKYLRQLIIGVYTDPDNLNSVIEAYTFQFTYLEKKTTLSCNGEEVLSVSTEELDVTKKATLALLRAIIVLTQSLDPLPNDAYLTMKLLYYDEITPPDYEPPGFKPIDMETFLFKDEPINIKLGNVSTPFHVLKLRLKTDKRKFDMIEEKPLSESALNTPSKNRIFNDSFLSDTKENNKEKVDSEVLENLYSRENLSMMDTDIDTQDLITAGSDPYYINKNINCEKSKKADGGDHLQSTAETKKVRCPCGFQEIDESMLLCTICNMWQHSVCFGILKDDQITTCHVCEKCSKVTDDMKPSTDPFLSDLGTVEQQALATWRRMLIFCTKLKVINSTAVARGLNVELCVADSLVARLEKEGFLTIGKGKIKGRKVVDKEKLMKTGFPKYMNSAKSKSCETIVDARSPVIDNENKENKKEEDKEMIDMLNKKTEKMTVTTADDKLKELFTLNQSRKRILTHNESHDFEVINSQENEEDIRKGKPKRRKASMCKKGISV